MRRYLCTLLLLVLLVGCGEDAGPATTVNNAGNSAVKKAEDNPIKVGPMSEYPEWVSLENNTYTDENGSAVIYAIGVATRGRNPTMQWDAAKNNAMVNTSRILNTHMRAMLGFYAQESGNFYDEGTLKRIRKDEQVSRTITENFASNAMTINKYLTPDRKEAYILMRLDLDNELLQSMSDKAKAALREQFATKDRGKTDEALAKMNPALTKLKQELAKAPSLPPAVR